MSASAAPTSRVPLPTITIEPPKLYLPFLGSIRVDHVGFVDCVIG